MEGPTARACCSASGCTRSTLAHWALQLKYPTSVECSGESEGQTAEEWGDDEYAPLRVPPARLPPLKAYWYDGVRICPSTRVPPQESPRPSVGKPEPSELGPRDGRRNTRRRYRPTAARCLSARKGNHLPALYSDSPGWCPEQKYKDFPQPPRNTHACPAPGMFGSHADFIRACTEGATALLELPRRFRALYRSLAGGQPGDAGRRRQKGPMGRRRHEVHQYPRAEPVREARCSGRKRDCRRGLETERGAAENYHITQRFLAAAFTGNPERRRCDRAMLLGPVGSGGC